MGDAGDVEVVGGVEEEEGFVLVRLDEFVRLLDPLVGEVFIAEARVVSAGVKADAGDAIVNGSVVPVGPIHLEGVAVTFSGGVIRGGSFVSHPERVGGIEVEDAGVGEVDLRDAVVCGGEKEVVVETNFLGAGVDAAIPVWTLAFFSKAEVPLADDSGLVARLLHDVGQGEGVGINDEVTIWWSNPGA